MACPGCPDADSTEPSALEPVREEYEYDDYEAQLELLPCPPHPAINESRFEFASDRELAKLAEGITPKNTERSTKWALDNFFQWKIARNTKFPCDKVPDDFLQCTDIDTLNKYLAMFAVETRKSDGKPYPPATLHQLLCGLIRYFRANNPHSPNFLDKKDARFRHLHSTLDSLFHKLHADGVGRQVKHAEVLTKEDEDKLWEAGEMDIDTPTGLLNAAFFVVGKMFCLRGGQEHRNLQLSQLKRSEDKYVYYENVSKNRNGTFRQLRVKNKVVPLYACPELGNKCPVAMLDKYIAKLPPAAKEKDLFYCRPLEKPKNPSKPWYSVTAVGKNALQSKLKDMCSRAGISGLKTNHSLRATAATEMFQLGAPEKVIQERTGHRSIEALRSYERSSESQHRAISSLLTSSGSSDSQLVYRQHTNTKSLNMPIPSAPSIYSQPMPSITLQNLHGCTINFNCTPSSTAPVPTQPALPTYTETEIDELFSQIVNDNII